MFEGKVEGTRIKFSKFVTARVPCARLCGPFAGCSLVPSFDCAHLVASCEGTCLNAFGSGRFV